MWWYGGVGDTRKRLLYALRSAYNDRFVLIWHLVLLDGLWLRELSVTVIFDVNSSDFGIFNLLFSLNHIKWRDVFSVVLL